MCENGVSREGLSEYIGHGLVGMIALHPAADIHEDEIAVPESSASVAKQRDCRGEAKAASRAVECGGVETVLSKPDLTHDNFGVKHAEPDRSMVPFFNEEGIEEGAKRCFTHTAPEQFRNPFFEHSLVNPA